MRSRSFISAYDRGHRGRAGGFSGRFPQQPYPQQQAPPQGYTTTFPQQQQQQQPQQQQAPGRSLTSKW